MVVVVIGDVGFGEFLCLGVGLAGVDIVGGVGVE